MHQKNYLPSILSKVFNENYEIPDAYTFLLDFVGKVNLSILVGLDPSALTKQIMRSGEDRSVIIRYLQKNWVNHLLTPKQRESFEHYVQHQVLNFQRVNRLSLSEDLVKCLTYETASPFALTEKEFKKARQFFIQTVRYKGMSDLVRQFVEHAFDIEDAKLKGKCNEVVNRLSTKLRNVQQSNDNLSYEVILQTEPTIILWAFGLISDIRSYHQRCFDLSIGCPISKLYSSPDKVSVDGLASIVDEVLSDAQIKDEKWFAAIVDTFGSKTNLYIVLSSYFQYNKLSKVSAQAKSQVKQAILYKFGDSDGRVSNEISPALLVKCGMHMHALKNAFSLTEAELKEAIPLILNSEHLSTEEIIELIRVDKKVKALDKSNELVEVGLMRLAYEVGINATAIKLRIKELRKQHGGRELGKIPNSLEIISRPRSKSSKTRNDRRNSDTLGSFYVAGVIANLHGVLVAMIKIGWTKFDVSKRLDSICDKQSENIKYGLTLVKTFYTCADNEIPISYDLEQEFKRQLVDLKIQRPLLDTNAHGKEEIFLLEDIEKIYPQLLEEEFAKKKYLQLQIKKQAKIFNVS